jgi:hypothetical protein
MMTDRQTADPALPPARAADRSRKAAKAPPFVADEEVILSASDVIIDRDKLRELRLSEASEKVFALSKGEHALAEVRSHKGGSKHIHMVNPYDLHFEPGHNPRDFTTPFFRGRVASFAYSIAERGVRQPLDVYIKDGQMFVNGGDTRWRGTLHAINFLNVPIERIPVIISQGENDAERKINQWIGNDQIRFEPIAEAELFRGYLDLGGDMAVFAKRIGKPKSYLEHRILLLEMPEWLKAKVADGSVAHETAYKQIWLGSGEDVEKAKELLAKAADKAPGQKVRPRHVRAAITDDGAAIIERPNLRYQLATILDRHERATIEQWFGIEDAATLFKLAKLDKIEAPPCQEDHQNVDRLA